MFGMIDGKEVDFVFIDGELFFVLFFMLIVVSLVVSIIKFVGEVIWFFVFEKGNCLMVMFVIVVGGFVFVIGVVFVIVFIMKLI